MKFTIELELAVPRDKAIRLLQDPTSRPKWLRGLVAHAPISGEEGQVGTESRVVFGSGRHVMECTETITRREAVDLADVPAETVVHFEREIVARGMWSAAREHLSEAGGRRTNWVSENEYRFADQMRLLAPLIRGSFVKQTRQHMEDFKAFAERCTDVRDS
ncbi:SRPBCC family protein [Propionibacteriaceae bacterium Y1700]|uniref:SRPBCC family protein n=1 Tax=Microlunatus sp. Y1700 TaxID=3418487 RepID=UPI003DA7168D